MYKVRIVTPYVGSGKNGDPYRPSFGAAYAKADWSDITGQTTGQIVPDPDAYTVEAILSDDDYAALEADTRFVIVVSEQIVEVKA